MFYHCPTLIVTLIPNPLTPHKIEGKRNTTDAGNPEIHTINVIHTFIRPLVETKTLGGKTQ